MSYGSVSFNSETPNHHLKDCELAANMVGTTFTFISILGQHQLTANYRIHSSSMIGKRLLCSGSTLRQSFLKPPSPRMQSGTIPCSRGFFTGLSSRHASARSSCSICLMERHQSISVQSFMNITIHLWIFHSSKSPFRDWRSKRGLVVGCLCSWCQVRDLWCKIRIEQWLPQVSICSTGYRHILPSC